MTKYTDMDALMKDFDGIDLTKCVKYGNKDAEQQCLSYSTMMMYEIASALNYAPAADVVEVRHGRWEQNECDYLMDRIVCSCCKKEWNVLDNCTEDFCYCPNCGAKMDEEGV